MGLSLLWLNRSVIANSCCLRDCRTYARETPCNSEAAGRCLAATAGSVAGTGLFLVPWGTEIAAWIREGRAGQRRDAMEQQQGLISEKHLRSQCTLNAPEASYSVFCCA